MSSELEKHSMNISDRYTMIHTGLAKHCDEYEETRELTDAKEPGLPNYREAERCANCEHFMSGWANNCELYADMPSISGCSICDLYQPRIEVSE